jgi:hypothetical protein
VHAALKQQYAADHIASNRTPPVAQLTDNREYAAAFEAAKQASLPDKGERPNRDPQVRHQGSGGCAAGRLARSVGTRSGSCTSVRRTSWHHSTLKCLPNLQEGTVNDTVSYEQMQTLCIEMLGSDIHTAPRDMSMRRGAPRPSAAATTHAWCSCPT